MDWNFKYNKTLVKEGKKTKQVNHMNKGKEASPLLFVHTIIYAYESHSCNYNWISS